MSIRDELLLSYDGLGDGITLAGELCPACRGGSTEECTLSVTKEDGKLKWYCHRASCEFAGAEYSGSNYSRPSTTKQVSCRGVVGRILAKRSEAIPDSIKEELFQKYSITDTHTARWGIGWDEQSRRIVLPVLGTNQEQLGAALRTLDKTVKPKTLSHTEQGAMAWYTNHTTKALIIVEDQLSAIRSADYMNSCALLGTNLSDERMEVIREAKFSPIYLALDKDAWSVAVKYAIKYRLQLLRLNKDIKNMTNEEASCLLSGL